MRKQDIIGLSIGGGLLAITGITVGVLFGVGVLPPVKQATGPVVEPVEESAVPSSFNVKSIETTDGNARNVASKGIYTQLTAQEIAAVSFDAAPDYAWTRTDALNRWVTAVAQNGGYELRFYDDVDVDLLMTSDDVAGTADPVSYMGGWTHVKNSDDSPRVVVIESV